MTATGSVDVGVVIPIYNEASTIDELVARCSRALAASVPTFEILFVDDASNDRTPQVAAAYVADPHVRFLRLPRNLGQFGATQAGLKESRGDLLVVLDGDLQDPPEAIPRLVAAAEKCAVVLAVKTSRADPKWFLVGQAIYHALQAGLGGGGSPSGAGSFCAMRRHVADRVARFPLRVANLGCVLGALRVPWERVEYEKQARVDGVSRVGPVGLAREALISLTLSGAMSRIAIAIGIAVGLTLPLLALRRPRAQPSTSLLLVAISIFLVAGGTWLRGTVRRWLV